VKVRTDNSYAKVIMAISVEFLCGMISLSYLQWITIWMIPYDPMH